MQHKLASTRTASIIVINLPEALEWTQKLLPCAIQSRRISFLQTDLVKLAARHLI